MSVPRVQFQPTLMATMSGNPNENVLLTRSALTSYKNDRQRRAPINAVHALDCSASMSQGLQQQESGNWKSRLECGRDIIASNLSKLNEDDSYAAVTFASKANIRFTNKEKALPEAIEDVRNIVTSGATNIEDSLEVTFKHVFDKRMEEKAYRKENDEETEGELDNNTNIPERDIVFFISDGVATRSNTGSGSRKSKSNTHRDAAFNAIDKWKKRFDEAGIPFPEVISIGMGLNTEGYDAGILEKLAAVSGTFQYFPVSKDVDIQNLCERLMDAILDPSCSRAFCNLKFGQGFKQEFNFSNVRNGCDDPFVMTKIENPTAEVIKLKIKVENVVKKTELYIDQIADKGSFEHILLNQLYAIEQIREHALKPSEFRPGLDKVLDNKSLGALTFVIKEYLDSDYKNYDGSGHKKISSSRSKSAYNVAYDDYYSKLNNESTPLGSFLTQMCGIEKIAQDVLSIMSSHYISEKVAEENGEAESQEGGMQVVILSINEKIEQVFREKHEKRINRLNDLQKEKLNYMKKLEEMQNKKEDEIQEESALIKEKFELEEVSISDIEKLMQNFVNLQKKVFEETKNVRELKDRSNLKEFKQKRGVYHHNPENVRYLDYQTNQSWWNQCSFDEMCNIL